MAAQLTLQQRIVRQAVHFRKMRENWGNSWSLFRQKPLGMLGVLLIVMFGLMAVAHPLLMSTFWDRSTYHPLVGFDYDLVPHPTLPSLKHFLGTDSMGRDIFSRVIYGTRISLIISTLTIFAGLFS